MPVRAEYFAGVDFRDLRLSRIDQKIEFNWSQSPDNPVPASGFSVRWRGFLVPRYSEKYTLTTTSNDGVRLWLDDVLVIDNWSRRGAKAATVTLEAGRAHRLRMEYFDAAGAGRATLTWQSKSQEKETVPSAALLMDAPPEAPAASNGDLKPVSGQVTSADRGAVAGVRVQIVDRNVGASVVLAETVTDERGRFTTGYAPPKAKLQPDLQAVVITADGKRITSAVLYAADEQARLDVHLPTGTTGVASEHETLSAGLVRHVPSELSGLDVEDLGYLAGKSGWDARAIAMAALAEQLATDTGEERLTSAHYYALLRAGLPADAERLHRVGADVAERVWKQAAADGVVPASLAEETPTEAWTRAGATHALDAAALPGADTLGALLDVSLDGDRQAKQRFARLLTEHGGEPAKLWEAAAGAFGEERAQRLRADGQLAAMTLDNAAVIRKLRDDGVEGPPDLAARGLYRAEAWERLIEDAAPNFVPGGIGNYAELLAAQVRLSFPTAVIADRVGRGELKLNGHADEVHAFLANSDFEIGAEPIDRFAPTLDEPVRAEIRRLQRVYQITPDDRALAALLERDLDSAYRIAEYGAADFVDALAEPLGGAAIAEAVYTQGQRVHHAVLNLATTYLTEQAAPTLGIDRAEPILKADTAAVPDLEQLFDALDFCACEDCRTVVSPAAYLVELLRFTNCLHPERENPQRVLFARRPDLPQLPLTCENTNTALPYVDLVNETLEYIVAHGGISGYAGHDTGGHARPEELLAAPAHVEPRAYKALARESFPPPLPFDRNLELLRREFAALGVPLAEAMERLGRDGRIERLGVSPAEHRLLTKDKIGPASLYGYADDDTAVAALRDAEAFSRRARLSYDELVALLQTAFINPDRERPLLLNQRPDAPQPCSLGAYELGYADGSPPTAEDYVRLARFIRLWRKLGWTLEQTDTAVTALGGDFAILLDRLSVALTVAARLELDLERDLESLLTCWADLPPALYRRLFAAYDRAFVDLPEREPLAEHTEALRAAGGLIAGELQLVLESALEPDALLTVANVSVVYRHAWLARRLRLSVGELTALTVHTGIDPFAPPDPAQPGLSALLDLLEGLRAAGLEPTDVFERGTEPDVAPLAGAIRAGLARVNGELSLGEGSAARARVTLVYGTEATDLFFSLLDGTFRVSADYSHAAEELPATVLTAGRDRLTYDDLHKRVTYAGLLDATTRAALLTAEPALVHALEDLSDQATARTAAVFTRFPELRDAYKMFSGEPERRTAALAGLIPALVTRRKHAVALEALTTALGADVELVTALANDRDVLGTAADPTRPALDDLLALEAEGLTATFFWSTPGSPTAPSPTAVNYAPLPSRAGGPPQQGIWTGSLEAPEAGVYAFAIDTDGTSVTLSLDGRPVTLQRDGSRWRTNAPIEFAAGSLTPLALRVVGASARLALRWQRSGHGWEVVPAGRLYPVAALRTLRTTFARVARAVALADAVRLTPRELVYLAKRPVRWLELLGTGTPELQDALAELFALTRLKRVLGREDAALLAALANPAWPPTELDAVLEHLSLTRADLARPLAFARVHDVFALLDQLGCPLTEALAAAIDAPDAETVVDLQGVLRARYGERDWLTVLRPINDELRALQRDALVACVLRRYADDPATAAVDTPDRLYEHLLMDVQMEPVMQTSRIRFAIASVQQFVDRCLMNLERDVAPSSIDAAQWEWMKRYRVWEANRKLFLWPENWLEPELRDDQSPFFKELMAELLKGDVDADSAATAYAAYLSKLDAVARLDAGALWVEDDVVHVVGRTAGSPRRYYSRRREAEAWTGWEPMPAEIEDGPVALVVWRGREFAFWLRVLTEPETSTPPGDAGGRSLGSMTMNDVQSGAPSRLIVKALLCYAERVKGVWGAVKTSDPARPVRLGACSPAGLPGFRAALTLTADSGDSLVLRLDGPGGATFTLHNTHSAPIAVPGRHIAFTSPGRILTDGASLAVDYPRANFIWLNDVELPDDERTGWTLLESRDLPLTVAEPPPSADAPFVVFDERHAFYVVTSYRRRQVAELVGFGLGGHTRLHESKIRPMVWQGEGSLGSWEMAGGAVVQYGEIAIGRAGRV